MTTLKLDTHQYSERLIYKSEGFQNRHPIVSLLGKAVIISLVVTIGVGLLSFYGKGNMYDNRFVFLILVVQFFTIIFPIAYALHVYIMYNDVFDPSFIAALSFIIFHIAFNPSVLGSPDALALRNFFLINNNFIQIVIYSYAVICVSWYSYFIGHILGFKFLPVKPQKRIPPSKITLLYMLVGITYIIIGLIGNIGAIGGIESYLSKTLRFFERSDQYVEIMGMAGSTKWVIAMRFFPIGIILLGYGYILSHRKFAKQHIIVLLILSILNTFLNSATGQRSATLMAFIYTGILIHYSVKKLNFRTLILAIIAIFGVSIILGAMRDAAYFGIGPFSFLMDNFFSYLDHFVSLYLTNYLGTLALVREVFFSGTIHGATAFAGLTGLLGGPTPLTTQAEMWYRLTGKYDTSNPRYGPPGELFFNFGWPGVIIGMMLIGFLVSVLAKTYRSHRQEMTVSSGIMAVFTIFTAWFIVIGNLSYIPSYFTYYALPFYFIFWAFRNRRC